MNLISAIWAGCFLAVFGAVASLVAGYGWIAAFGFYVLFGVLGTLFFAIVNWIRPSPFVRPRREKLAEKSLELAKSESER